MCAGASLVVIWPALLASAAAIALLDGGPVLFTQERLGHGRRSFRVFKLRTMREGVVTPVGRGLRRTRLDELPQLLNVLRGDMSLVGPRPITQADVERLEWEGEDADTRWSVRPGITGPTQLSTVCDASAALRRDCRYAARKSSAGDARLMLATLAALVGGRRAGERLAGAWV